MIEDQEKQRMEKIIPPRQAKTHCIMKVYVEINEKLTKDCVIALTEHFVVIGKKGFFGGFSSIISSHFFDIYSMELVSGEEILICLEEDDITIKGENLDEFYNLCVRNYQAFSALIQPNDRIAFQSFNEIIIPKFDLSPSQVFQFYYYAYCSYLDTS